MTDDQRRPKPAKRSSLRATDRQDRTGVCAPKPGNGGRLVTLAGGCTTQVRVYCAELADEIVNRLERGETLTSICESRPDMPTTSSICEWVTKRPEFAERYVRAREQGFDRIAENCLKIADEEPRDRVHVDDKKVRVDTRLRLLSKWHPTVYGDKVAISGNLAAVPVFVIHAAHASA